MYEITSFDCSRVAQDLQIRKVQVEAVVQLFDEGNTVPFITRYRKERTGGLDEEVIRQIQKRVNFIRQLAERRHMILKSLETQDRLTEDLHKAIMSADTLKRLEDLYLPYKPKKKSLAHAARERGLEPLALGVWNRDPAVGPFEELLPSFVNPDKGLATVDDVRAGVQHILAEMIAETADVRAEVRIVLWEAGKIRAVKSDKLAEGQGLEYKDYFDFTEPARQIPAHRILALNRGDKENALKVHLDFNNEIVHQVALKMLAEHLLHKPLTLGLARPKSVEPAPNPAAEQTPPAAGAISDTPADANSVQPQVSPVAESAAVAPPCEPPAPLVVESAVVAPPCEPPAPSVVESAAVAPPIEPPASPVVETAAVAPPAPPVVEAAAVALPTEPSTPFAEATATPASRAAPEPVAQMDSPAHMSLPSMEITEPAALPGEILAPGCEYKTPHTGLLRNVLDDALARLLLPSLEREIRHELTDEAEAHAVAVFARNLRSLLLQPPLHNRRILSIDPGLRTGCKVAALDEFGILLENTVVHLLGPHPKRSRDRKKETPPAAPAAGDQSVPPTPLAEVSSPAGQSEPMEGGTGIPPVHSGENPAPSIPTETPAPEPIGETPIQPIQPSTAAQDQAVAGVNGTDVQSVPENPDGSKADIVTKEAEDTSAVTQSPDHLVTLSSSEAPPPDHRAEARAKLKDLLLKHQIQIIALGNGTGCRDIEELIADLIAGDLPELAYVIVNEAGASVYSVSAYGREEFPNFDSTLRSTISIGRRLQDPLSELVKVDPPNIGVGLYQHDINRKELRESLDAVVESCVNQVGVDLNTASVPLLRHVSGLNQLVARELVEHRQKNGAFTSREQLLQVPGVGSLRFVQAAGFLKIPTSENPLDRTWIHPESYALTEKILGELGFTPKILEDKAGIEAMRDKFNSINVEDLAKKLNAGFPTVDDILYSLARPGRDPREDLPPPIFKKGILKLEDLQAGMELKGTVLNVVDFGAFVDIGLKDSGLVHISQMANRYIKSPYDVVAVSDVVTVWVLIVDKDRHRVSLTMIKPGTERAPGERREPRGERRDRPQRERRPAVAEGGTPSQDQGPVQEGQGPRPGQGQRRGDRRRPPHGRPPGRRPGPAPAPGQVSAQTDAGPSSAVTGTPPPPTRTPPPPPPPPRKPRREPPKPKLSQAALEGKVPLRTFGELSVLFATKTEKKPEAPAPVPEPPASPVAEPPAAAPPVAESPVAEPPVVDAGTPPEGHNPTV